MSEARAEYEKRVRHTSTSYVSDRYVEELEEFLKNSEESEKELSKLLIECKHRIEELEELNSELVLFLFYIWLNQDKSFNEMDVDIKVRFSELITRCEEMEVLK